MLWLINILAGGLIRRVVVLLLGLLLVGGCATLLPKLLRTNAGSSPPQVVLVSCKTDPAAPRPAPVAPTTIGDVDPALLEEFEQWLEDQSLMN